MSQIHGVNPNGEVTEVAVENNGRLLISGGSGATATQGLGAYQSVVLQSAAAATGNGTVIDVSGMGALGIVVAGTFVGTITFESKDAAGNWNAAMCQLQGTTTLTSTATAPGVYHRPTAGFGAFRARVSAYTSGTITVTAFAENTGYTPMIQNMGIYEKLDSVNDSVTNYPMGHTATYISTATTTVCKTGAGVLQSIIVQGGTTGTIIVYDNTAASGTILASFDTTNALANYLFNCAFSTGLTVVTSAATKLTVTWR